MSKASGFQVKLKILRLLMWEAFREHMEENSEFERILWAGPFRMHGRIFDEGTSEAE
jgi:hypothetical protein